MIPISPIQNSAKLTKTARMTMAPPTGLLLGRNPRKPTHRVGNLIGEGACSSVYELESLDGISDEHFAIKIAPLPPPKPSSKKRKPTPVERNANLLNYETIMYTAQLNKLRGTYIPAIPSSKGPPQSGDVDGTYPVRLLCNGVVVLVSHTLLPLSTAGFRFLVMEKMDGTLYDVIPRLLAGKRTRQGKIPFGTIAARLLDCIQALHETGFLFVDVKPENFMLSKNGKTIADSIRMIDFGLIQPVKSIHGHRPNEGTSALVGTPLYSSLNVHDGQTHSRRDDLEALGYIVGELLMKLVAVANGATNKTVQLPWSHGTSDEHIAKLKETEVSSTKSKFFDSIGMYGNEAAQQVMRDYVSAVRAMNYKQTPDYDSLRDLLLRLDVVAAKPTKKPAARKATPTKKKKTAPTSPSSSRKSARAGRAAAKRASPDSDNDNEDVPPKIRRVLAIDDDDDFNARDRRSTASEDTGFVTARDVETEDMDWDLTEEQDSKPRSMGPRLGIKVLFTQGPHKGESFALVKKEMETVYLGGNPTAKDGDGFAMPGDDQVDDTHIKLVLQANKRMQTVLVTNLSSSSGTFINGSSIPAKKERKVFINDTITIGGSVLKIMKLPQDKEPQPTFSPPTQKPAAVAKTRSDENKKPPSNKPPPTGPGVRITFKQGQHNDFYLAKSDVSRIVIGSNPSSKKDETITIPDASVDATHARLELIYARKLCTVTVTDLKSSSGTFVSASRIPSGKDRKAFINDLIQVGDVIMQVKPL